MKIPVMLQCFSFTSAQFFGKVDIFDPPFTFNIRRRLDPDQHKVYTETFPDLLTEDDDKRLEAARVILQMFLLSLDSGGVEYKLQPDREEVDSFTANWIEADPVNALNRIVDLAFGVIGVYRKEREAILGKPKTVPAVSNTTAKEKPKAARKRQG
jgi:hypothetical protein